MNSNKLAINTNSIGKRAMSKPRQDDPDNEFFNDLHDMDMKGPRSPGLPDLNNDLVDDDFFDYEPNASDGGSRGTDSPVNIPPFDLRKK